MLHVTIFITITLVACGQGVDWCSYSCGSGINIGCHNEGTFSPSCSSPQKVEMSWAYKKILVDTHNALRNKITGGKLTRFPSARRMAQVQWDDQLAYLADLNTKQCKMAHDQCRRTPLFKYAGQNLAYYSTTGSYNTDTFLHNMMNLWWNENSKANINDIKKFTLNGKMIGHFTVMANDHDTRIGCGMSKYKSGGSWNTYLLTCNYAFTNMIGRPVYQSGTATQGCTKGRDSRYQALCKISEPIDPNENLVEINAAE